ncbi:hypothetical protein [Pseudomaricurvus sp.]|uniref:hypothetical protein n=1 Tax=Pseudomaricurvus sp. TaxID=2004510 RepID=UPI003F6B5772
MTLIPNTQMVMGREKRQLAEALSGRDWHAVKQGDARMMDAVSQAADDPSKDMATLLKELREVVGLYRDILAQCDISVQALAADTVEDDTVNTHG